MIQHIIAYALMTTAFFQFVCIFFERRFVNYFYLGLVALGILEISNAVEGHQQALLSGWVLIITAFVSFIIFEFRKMDAHAVAQSVLCRTDLKTCLLILLPTVVIALWATTDHTVPYHHRALVSGAFLFLLCQIQMLAAFAAHAKKP